MAQFSTLIEVQDAVKAGETVYWSNNEYLVTVDLFGQWHITYRPWGKNPHSVGLFWTDGTTSDYNPEDFFTASGGV